ncbi:MAG: CoA-binding protein, partial [Proteobacteria bacterium]
MGQQVAILGASKNPERYSYKAFEMLKEYGHTPLPINPGLDAIEGAKVYAKLTDITSPVDTLT